MRIAVMDLGTNTFHLDIVERINGKVKTLYAVTAPVKLGEGGIASGTISKKPFQRGLRTMKQFKKKLDQYKPGKIIATGTAAIRNASNKKAFLEAIREKTGITVTLIHGLKEASLIYDGVKQAVRLGEDKTLIMDIGGGSLEFIIANGKKISWKHSFPLGAALLLDRFKPFDPISSQQIGDIRKFLARELRLLPLALKEYGPVSLTGSSGSFDTFAEMIGWRNNTPSILKNKTSYIFRLEDYKKLHLDLVYSTAEERGRMKGLPAMRADMIVMASLLLTYVLEKFKPSQFQLSTYALKEGIMWRILTKGKI